VVQIAEQGNLGDRIVGRSGKKKRPDTPMLKKMARNAKFGKKRRRISSGG
jgi:hypothetical protein